MPPIWINELMLRAVSTVVDKVQKSVDANNGESCRQPFSQCKPPVRNAITTDKESSGGICEGLSANWVKHSIVDKQTLGEWLCKGGRVDMDKLTVAQVLQGVGQLEQHNQSELSAKWLKNQGIVLRAFRQDIENTGAGPLADEIAGTQDGDHRMIGVTGKFTGHAMAAKVVNGGEVTFFDPNFGEFAFRDAIRFKDWFANRFWSKSCYNIGLSSKFSVYSYSKA